MAESRGRASGRVWDGVPLLLQKRFAKGELKKQSTGLFFKRGRLATEDSLIEENIIKPNRKSRYKNVSAFLLVHLILITEKEYLR